MFREFEDMRSNGKDAQISELQKGVFNSVRVSATISWNGGSGNPWAKLQSSLSKWCHLLFMIIWLPIFARKWKVAR